MSDETPTWVRRSTEQQTAAGRATDATAGTDRAAGAGSAAPVAQMGPAPGPDVLGLRFSGGPGTTAVNLEELDAVGRVLDRIAELCAQAAEACTRAGAMIDFAVLDGCAVAGEGAVRSALGALSGPLGPAGAAATAEELAGSVGAARRTYAGAEEAAKGGVAGAFDSAAAAVGANPLTANPWIRAWTMGPLVGGAWAPVVGRYLGGAGSGNAQVDQAEVATATRATGRLLGTWPPRGTDPVTTAARGLTGLVNLAGGNRPAKVSCLTSDRTAAAAPGAPCPAGTTGRAVGVPGGAGDIVRATSRTARQLTGSGRSATARPDATHVRIDRITLRDGRTGWVVHVPGTVSQYPGYGTVPADNGSNVQSISGDRSVMSDATRRAMDQVGIRAGEPVVLAGHSQGGMVAATLAGDPEVRSRYAVTSVLTFGSPVAASQVPDDVQMLSLEHDEDLIVGLDGAENPHAANRVTVRRSLASSPDGVDRALVTGLTKPLGPHGAPAYARTADAVDVLEHPSLEPWRQAAGRAIGTPQNPAVSATAYEFEIIRQ